MTAIQAYILAKKIALSAVSGIQNITLGPTGQLIFVFNDGTQATWQIPLPKDGVDGVSVVNLQIDSQNHLICTLSDGSTIDAGELPGANATAGGLIQVKNFDSLTYPGEEGALYLTLDTQMVYYWDKKSKLYKPVTTNGIKNDGLTKVDQFVDDSIIFDGIEQTFDLPVDDTKINVYVNGMYMTEDIDYEIDRNVTPNTITFTELWEEFDSCILTWVEGTINDTPGTTSGVGLSQLKEDITSILNPYAYIDSSEISSDPWPQSITLSGSKIKGYSTQLTLDQKKILKMVNIINTTNSTVLGCGIITNYNSSTDMFTIALTKYGQGSSDIEANIVDETKIDKLFEGVPGIDPTITIVSEDDIDKLFTSMPPSPDNNDIYVSEEDIDNLFK